MTDAIRAVACNHYARTHAFRGRIPKYRSGIFRVLAAYLSEAESGYEVIFTMHNDFAPWYVAALVIFGQTSMRR
jgi:hypothetical protein